MTSLPAATIGLGDRGRVAQGFAADLVLFDPASVTDNATWETPAALATGIEHVLIGGAFAVQDGRPANLRLGRVLRRQSGQPPARLSGDFVVVASDGTRERACRCPGRPRA